MAYAGMNVKFAWQGGKIANRLITKAVMQASLDPLLKCGYETQRESKRSMRKGKKGKPSKPGTPPHKVTGRMANSIRTAQQDNGVVVVGTTGRGWYGAIHEHGSYKRRRFPPRPFMQPALVKISRKFPQHFKGMNLAGTNAGRQLNAKKGPTK